MNLCIMVTRYELVNSYKRLVEFMYFTLLYFSINLIKTFE